MRDFDAVREQILTLFPDLRAAAARRGATATGVRLEAARDRVVDGRLTVVVCGEFKRGKSSLLNALLDEWRAPQLFPEAGEIATNTVTTVSYGPAEEITALVETDAGTETVPIGRAEIAGYVTEGANPRNGRRARLITVETPNPKLASGLTLVDTPGVGGVYQDHTAATMAFLPSADAVVFVADATQPLLESELRFLRRAARAVAAGDSLEALQFVLTKTDTGDFTAILANTRDKIAAALDRPADQVVITPVSAHAKRDYLEGGDEEDLELSNFGEFEARLWTALARWRIRRLLGGALLELESSARALLVPITEEIEALADDTKQRVADLTAQAEQRQHRLTELRQDSASWRRDLAAQTGDLGRSLTATGQRRLDEVWHVFITEYLRDDAYLFHPDRLVGQLTADAAQVIGELNEQAARAAAQLLGDFTDRHGLDLGSARLGRLPAPDVPPLRFSGDLYQEYRSDPVKRRLRDVSLGGGIGSTVGGFLGTLLVPIPGVGTVLGAALGGLLGGTAGYRSSRQDEGRAERQGRRQSLQQELRPVEAEQRRHVAGAVPDLVREFSRAMTAELDSRLAREQETLRDRLSRLAAAREATEEKARLRTAELTAEQAPLIAVRERIAELTSVIDG
ncbi:GTPase SAR1 family protein [Actinoplanes tereljensis]|uniref:Isoniazid-induced protein IniA n=1 Tax=Paractinoplanes tereljensis TaxID=571912 RepID=A0A919TTU9_9ACTN|nr:dynamin family protein [Actinoplanes tereljensis]GIF20377.1 isoniazid-induced protein IniA [Actinoplanes tereljensis]